MRYKLAVITGKEPQYYRKLSKHSPIIFVTTGSFQGVLNYYIFDNEGNLVAQYDDVVQFDLFCGNCFFIKLQGEERIQLFNFVTNEELYKDRCFKQTVKSMRDMGLLLENDNLVSFDTEGRIVSSIKCLSNYRASMMLYNVCVDDGNSVTVYNRNLEVLTHVENACVFDKDYAVIKDKTSGMYWFVDKYGKLSEKQYNYCSVRNSDGLRRGIKFVFEPKNDTNEGNELTKFIERWVNLCNDHEEYINKELIEGKACTGIEFDILSSYENELIASVEVGEEEVNKYRSFALLKDKFITQRRNNPTVLSVIKFGDGGFENDIIVKLGDKHRYNKDVKLFCEVFSMFNSLIYTAYHWYDGQRFYYPAPYYVGYSNKYNKYGILDEKFDTIVDFEYDFINQLNEDVYELRKDGKYDLFTQGRLFIIRADTIIRVNDSSVTFVIDGEPKSAFIPPA